MMIQGNFIITTEVILACLLLYSKLMGTRGSGIVTLLLNRYTIDFGSLLHCLSPVRVTKSSTYAKVKWNALDRVTYMLLLCRWCRSCSYF